MIEASQGSGFISDIAGALDAVAELPPSDLDVPVAARVEAGLLGVGRDPAHRARCKCAAG
jgi:hypothetical protein